MGKGGSLLSILFMIEQITKRGGGRRCENLIRGYVYYLSSFPFSIFIVFYMKLMVYIVETSVGPSSRRPKIIV